MTLTSSPHRRRSRLPGGPAVRLLISTMVRWGRS